MLERRIDIVPARLVETASGLQLGILSVAVGQQIFPDAAFAGQGPQPDLASVFRVGTGAVIAAETPVSPPDAEESAVAADDVVRLVAAVGVVGIDGNVASLRVERPCARHDFAFVTHSGFAGEEEPGVAAQRIRRIHPVVVGRRKTRTVPPCRARLELVRAWLETDLHLPPSARNVFRARHKAARAAVAVCAHMPIDRGRRAGRMAEDAEVEFDSAGKPRAAHRDVAKLHHMVGVEEIAPRRLVRRTPDFPAGLGQDGDGNPAVVEDDGLPFALVRIERRAVVAKIRIASLGGRRNGVWV